MFGAVEFDEAHEYRAFQFKFLCVVMLAGAVSTLVFVAAAWGGANAMDSRHLAMMTLFSLVVLVLWALLRGHPQRFQAVAWAYLALCMLEFISALVNVDADELRVLWLFVNVPGVYLLLGRKVGLAVAVATGAGLVAGNPHLARPYSPNAMATALVALCYTAAFFHLYTARSISYFKRMRHYNERLAELASADPLTGVCNARAYQAICDRCLLSAERRGASSSVLFIDLDHFKRINDTLGHAAGDAVLKAVATTLARSIRRSDVLGRVGGEEFSIFLPDTTTGAATALAEKLRGAIAGLSIVVDGRPIAVTASIGVACARPGDVDMAVIQHRADQAMYLAKAAGRNRVSVLAADGSG